MENLSSATDQYHQFKSTIINSGKFIEISQPYASFSAKISTVATADHAIELQICQKSQRIGCLLTTRDHSTYPSTFFDCA